MGNVDILTSSAYKSYMNKRQYLRVYVCARARSCMCICVSVCMNQSTAKYRELAFDPLCFFLTNAALELNFWQRKLLQMVVFTF